MPLKKIRILIVDNDNDFLTMLEKLLLAYIDNILITKASSPEESLEHIDNGYFNLAIVDKRLIQDSDPGDESGIELVGKIAKIHPGIKIIMLTSFTNYKDVTKKLPDADEFGEPILCGYLSKKEESPKEWCAKIAEVIKNDIRITLDSEINLVGFRFKELNGLLVRIKIKDKVIEAKDTEVLDNLAIQLSDLLSKIYYKKGEITLLPLSQGYSGAGVVAIERDQNLPEIFKFGDRERIEKEYRNYKEHVGEKISARTYIDEGKFARTKDLGGIAYSLIGADLGNIKDFGDYFKENDSNQIKEFLSNFFSENCGIWYKRVQAEKPVDPKETYEKYLNLKASRLEENIRTHLPEFYDERKIDLPDFGLSFENPYFAFTNANFKPFKIRICRTHGDLNPRNILVDKDRGWLIDFFSVGFSHALRDFIKLETSVKFELTSIKNLAAHVHLEKNLLEPGSFKAEYGFRNYDDDPSLEKSFECIKHIRWLAYDLIGPKDIWEYYIGLFFTTLKHLEFDDVPGLSRKFAFISAGLILEKLKKQKLAITTTGEDR